jgi:hypothetical protein
MLLVNATTLPGNILHKLEASHQLFVLLTYLKSQRNALLKFGQVIMQIRSHKESQEVLGVVYLWDIDSRQFCLSLSLW